MKCSGWVRSIRSRKRVLPIATRLADSAVIRSVILFALSAVLTPQAWAQPRIVAVVNAASWRSGLRRAFIAAAALLAGRDSSIGRRRFPAVTAGYASKARAPIPPRLTSLSARHEITVSKQQLRSLWSRLRKRLRAATVGSGWHSYFTTTAKLGPHPAAHAPQRINRSMSASLKPASRRMARLCSPRAGGGPGADGGASDSSTGKRGSIAGSSPASAT